MSLDAVARSRSGGEAAPRGLRAGVRFRIAPRFHDPLGIAARLALSSCVTEVAAGRPAPRDDWRAPLEPDELGLLLAPQTAGQVGGGGSDALGPADVGLVLLPRHLREAWWALADHGSAASGVMPGFDGFAGEVLELLRFKGLPLPERCRCEVIASPPGQASTGLAAAPRLRAALNLGDEPASLVLLNLPARAASATLASLGLEARAEEPPAQVFARFRAALPAYPLVRVRLGPGAGLWLPDDDLLVDGTTVGNGEAALLLTIRAAP